MFNHLNLLVRVNRSMAYFFKQKLHYSDLAPVAIVKKNIFLVEPESYLAALYEHYLQASHFATFRSSELHGIWPLAASARPDALVLGVTNSSSVPNVVMEVTKFKREFPQLHVITVGY